MPCPSNGWLAKSGKVLSVTLMLLVCGSMLIVANHQLLHQDLQFRVAMIWQNRPPSQASVFNDLEYRTVDNASLSSVYQDFEIQSLKGVCKPGNHTSQRVTACCLGSSSAGGRVFYDANTCRPNQHEFHVLPALRNKHDTDPRLGFRTAADVIRLLGNRTLTFVGDSVMNQMHQAFHCGIFRENADITEVEYQGYDVHITGNDTRPAPNWRYSISAVDHTVYQQDHRISKVHYFRVYRPWMPMDGPLLLKHPCHILFFNFGLHYLHGQHEVFQSQIGAFLQFIISNTTTKSLIYRETSAQHSFSVGGEYNGNYDPSLGVDRQQFNQLQSTCTNTSLVYNEQVPKMFRETWFADLVQSLGIRVVRLNDDLELKSILPSPSQVVLYILPYYEYTSPRAALHPGFFGNSCDISHYCYYPYFYFPVWEELARILELIRYHRGL